ncbi:MAG: hypothetical protein ABXS92_01790 [Sulfurimonas sp.]
MPKLFKELYGAGILFFYYMKYIILAGWPILYFDLEYQENILLDILWLFCLGMAVKDILFVIRSNKQ